jgi:cell division septal protein FtsQ
MGLSPGYWLTLSIVLLVIFIILRVYMVIFLPLIFWGAVKLEKIQKAGNPNFIESMSNWNKMKKSFCDTRKFFDYL